MRTENFSTLCKIVICLGTLFFSGLPRAVGQAVFKVGSRLAQEEDIRAAVIKYFSDYWMKEEDKCQAFFIRVDHQDQSDAFVERFRGTPRTIKKYSAATQDKEPDSGIWDKDTCQCGVIFAAGALRWRNT